MAKNPCVTRKLREIFTVDLRALAAMRIGAAFVLILDLLSRLRDLTAHYADQGVLPLSALFDLYTYYGETYFYHWWSPHLLSGLWQFQLFLFILELVFALALLFGLKTRLATIFSWLLLMSLHARNPLVLYGADYLLRLVLFWGIFLPWGERYSLDAGKKAPRAQAARNNGFFSTATIAYFLQIAFIYWSAVLFKVGPEWKDGSAVYYALSAEHLATSLGQWLLNFPALLTFLTYAVVWFEILGPFLFFSPIFNRELRTAAVVLFIAMHLGFGAGLKIGFWPLIGAVAMLGLYPARDSIVSRRTTLAQKILPILLIIYVFFWNLGELPQSKYALPYKLKLPGFILGLEQKWDRFAPSPPTESEELRVVGALKNGESVELAKGFKNARWMKYAFAVTRSDRPRDFSGYGAYLCKNNGELVKLEFIYILVPTLRNKQMGAPVVNTQTYQCY